MEKLISLERRQKKKEKGKGMTRLSNLWSQDLVTKDRHYEFHIRETPRTGHRYLTITETSILAGRRQRVALTIRPQDALRFLKILQDAITRLS